MWHNNSHNRKQPRNKHRCPCGIHSPESNSSCWGTAAWPNTVSWTQALKMCCLRALKLGGSFSLSAMYLQNRCQCSSEMLESWVPLGQYAVQTNRAKVNCKASLTSTSSQRSQSLNHIVFCLHEHPEPSWRAYLSKPSSVVCPRECMESW